LEIKAIIVPDLFEGGWMGVFGFFCGENHSVDAAKVDLLPDKMSGFYTSR